MQNKKYKIMNNKYYTPKIEEFHVGFECEWQSRVRNETWNKQISDTDLVSIAYDAIEHSDEDEPFEEQFRVKYLDKDDIEDCGFTREFATFSEILKAPTEVYISEGKNLMLAYYPDLNKVTITTRDFSKNKITSKHTWDDKQVNLLTVNNKTEFIKLLKQLEVSNYI